jgi:hypothetical protein
VGLKNVEAVINKHSKVATIRKSVYFGLLNYVISGWLRNILIDEEYDQY